jgi:hypothetical protein
LSLCDKAFTRRTGGGLPLLGRVISSYHHSRYETTAIEEALKLAFSEDELLFGGKKYQSLEDQEVNFGCKVAVTTTSANTNSTVVLSNYNRMTSENSTSQN